MSEQRRAESTDRDLASMSEMLSRINVAHAASQTATAAVAEMRAVQYDHRRDTKDRELEPKTTYLVSPIDGSGYKLDVTPAKGKSSKARAKTFKADACEVVSEGDERSSYVEDGFTALVYSGEAGRVRVPAAQLHQVSIVEIRDGEVFSQWPPQEEVAVATAGLARAPK